MKNSEIYLKAQAAVVNSTFPTLDKLEILRVLMHQQDIAKYMEDRDAEKEKAE